MMKQEARGMVSVVKRKVCGEMGSLWWHGKSGETGNRKICGKSKMG